MKALIFYTFMGEAGSSAALGHIKLCVRGWQN